MPAPKNREELLEVKLLPSIRHVNDLIRIPCMHSMLERGEISRGVIRRAIALLDERGVRLQLRQVIEENCDRSFALAGDAELVQFLDDCFQVRIVKALAECVVELHTEARVDFVELVLREIDHFPPQGEVFGIAAL